MLCSFICDLRYLDVDLCHIRSKEWYLHCSFSARHDLKCFLFVKSHAPHLPKPSYSGFKSTNLLTSYITTASSVLPPTLHSTGDELFLRNFFKLITSIFTVNSKATSVTSALIVSCIQSIADSVLNYGLLSLSNTGC